MKGQRWKIKVKKKSGGEVGFELLRREPAIRARMIVMEVQGECLQ